MSDKVTVADVNVNDFSPEEIAKAIALMENTKIQRKRSQDRIKNDPEAAAKAKVRGERSRAKAKLLIAKAIDAGIEVTEAEVDDYLATA